MPRYFIFVLLTLLSLSCSEQSKREQQTTQEKKIKKKINTDDLKKSKSYDSILEQFNVQYKKLAIHSKNANYAINIEEMGELKQISSIWLNQLKSIDPTTLKAEKIVQPRRVQFGRRRKGIVVTYLKNKQELVSELLVLTDSLKVKQRIILSYDEIAEGCIRITSIIHKNVVEQLTHNFCTDNEIGEEVKTKLIRIRM